MAGLFQIAFLVILCLYCSVVLQRDKKYRKEMKKIARQEARKKHTNTVYVPIDHSKVVYLSNYRRKHKQSPA